MTESSIFEFVNPTLLTRDDERPTMNDHYAKNFNNVDLFNRLVALIAYKPRVATEKMAVLISLLEFAFVQSVVLVHDFQIKPSETVQEINMKKSLVDLSVQLHEL